ncbi:cell polarity tea1p [Chlorella sorokiniana]|uniref:Cell polarity tea1p n=1 Tax=Chlorella sorokiniana TaxID=3076 RepID=A0A2P6TC11_CHLSO|nr:cell polarity tea1p [Chlorella sorokiniana]|eukprot:PRW18416.1 cell polarity tea1p [Chlorella sorokiniana]
MAPPAKAAPSKGAKPATKAKTGKYKASPDGKKKKKASPSGAGKDEERKRLQAELEVARGSAAAQDAAARALEAELAALRLLHAQDTATSDDVLASQQQEQARLAAAARQLEAALEASRREAAQLQRALQDELDAAVAEQAVADGTDGQPSSELQRALSHQRRQEERITAQQREMEGLRARLQRAEDGLAASTAAVAALQVKAASRSELRFVEGRPWLLHVGRERLTGALPPAAQPGAALAAAGRRLVLEAPSGGVAEPSGLQQPSGQHSMHTLDLSSGVWTSAATEQAGGSSSSTELAAISGRAVCSIGGKLLGFGGACPDGSLLSAASATQQLLPDLPHWAPAPAPAEAAVLPAPRQGAALAYCSSANAAFMYGGQAQDGRCLDDLWRYDVALARWTRLDSAATARHLPAADRARTPCIPERPLPCSGAALAVSEAGDRVWLMGGTLEDGRCSNDLHWFDIGLRYWAAVEPQQSSCIVAPRTQHVMACIGRYLVVVGGLTRSASGAVTRRRDTCLWDTGSCTWEVLDDSAFEPQAPAGSSEPGAVVSMAAGREPGRRTTSGHRGSRTSSRREGGSSSAAPAAFLGAGSAAFLGSKLLLLKPSADSGLVSELWTVDLGCPPERIEELRAAKHAAAAVVQTLTLTCEGVAATSARLSWRAPTAGADKLLSYKLMMTNAEGLAREAYEGPETSCDVNGLPPNSQLVFCVKALYDDKRFLWSEPLMVTTAAKGGPRARQK